MSGWEHMEPYFPRMVELRRAIHRHPELAFDERHTARLVMDELDRLGIPYNYDGPGSAVIGRIDAAQGAPAVGLRAEMDALPGMETTGQPFRSEVTDRMHACGHDAHIGMLLGAAARLADQPPDGNVRLVFQPAEEKGGGARTVLDSGALEGVEAIFGGHVTHQYHVGEIMATEGVITAQSDQFLIDIQGRGGHGARPHEATDAIIVAGLLITAIQTLVSRETNPFHPSVITIGRVQGGTAPNIIAGEAVLEGSIRTTLPEVRRQVHSGLRRMAKAMGELQDARVSVEIDEGYPPVVNSTEETSTARRAAHAVVGDAGLVSMDYPSMGAEDFSYYLQRIPGCYVRFGALGRGEEPRALHSSAFDVDEEVLEVGAAWFDRVAREALSELRRGTH